MIYQLVATLLLGLDPLPPTTDLGAVIEGLADGTEYSIEVHAEYDLEWDIDNGN